MDFDCWSMADTSDYRSNKYRCNTLTFANTIIAEFFTQLSLDSFKISQRVLLLKKGAALRTKH